jgi:energy-coupling factor transporter transmembrane protein EcfT
MFSEKVEKYINNETCRPASFYLIARSALVLLSVGVLISLYRAKKLTTQNVIQFIVSLVLIVVYYNIITYTCAHKRNGIAWLLATLPLIIGLVLGVGLGYLGAGLLTPTRVASQHVLNLSSTSPM